MRSTLPIAAALWLGLWGLAGVSSAQQSFPISAEAAATHVAPFPPDGDPTAELARRLSLAEEELRRLRSELNDVERLPAVADADQVYAEAATAAATEARLAALEQAAAPPAPPKFPTVRLTGFFHLDAGWFSQDATSLANYGDVQDGVGFRRARLQAVGTLSEFTNYSLEMDFGVAGRPSFMDVWVEQTHLPYFGNVRIGHFREPFSMDALTPIRQLEFLERSLPFQALVPFRRVGIMAYDKSDNELTTWAYGVFRTGGFADAPLGDSRFATDIGDDGGFSFCGRSTHLLWYDEPAQGRYLLHVGGSYDYSRLTGSSDPAISQTYQARAIPEFFVGDPAGGGLTALGTPFILDTGRLLVDQFNIFGLEVAGQYGPAHFQAEYIAQTVDQIGGGTLFYDGAYIQAGYFLTGENRTYNRTVGAFDRVVPFTDFFGLGRRDRLCGWGAWEVVGRWSYLNLNDPAAIPRVMLAGPPPSPNPGFANESTIGLNWHWNTFTKLQFDWMHVNTNTRGFGRSDMDIFAARCQMEF